MSIKNDSMWYDLAMIEQELVKLGCNFSFSLPQENWANFIVTHKDFYYEAASTSSYLDAKQKALYAAYEYFTERNF